MLGRINISPGDDCVVVTEEAAEILPRQLGEGLQHGGAAGLCAELRVGATHLSQHPAGVHRHHQDPLAGQVHRLFMAMLSAALLQR